MNGPSNVTGSGPMEENYNEGTLDLLYDCCLGLLSVLIIVINIMVLIVFIHKPHLRTKTNCLLASLAVSDLAMGLLGIPSYISCAVTGLSPLCITSAVMYRFVAVSTMFHILFVTIERYISIIHPMRYLNIIKRQRLYAVIAFIWLFSLFIALIQLAWNDVNNFWAITETKIKGGIIYHTFGVIACFAVPFLVMAFIYGQMFAVIHRQVVDIRKQHIATDSQNFSPIYTELRAISVFATMLGVFAFCWITWYISIFQEYFQFHLDISEVGHMIFDFLRFCTSFINPVLYTYLKYDFKNAFKSMFNCKKIRYRNSSSSKSQATQLFDTQYSMYEDTKC